LLKASNSSKPTGLIGYGSSPVVITHFVPRTRTAMRLV